jgi:hypothetical protein
MYIAAQLLTDFVLIDRLHLVLIIDGVDSTGSPYAAGAFFMEDRGGASSGTLALEFQPDRAHGDVYHGGRSHTHILTKRANDPHASAFS